MKISRRAPKSPPGPTGSALQRLFSRRGASTRAGAPSAEFGTVTAARQPAVVRALQAALKARLQVPAPRQAAVNELLGHLGQPDFYDVLATLDAPAAKQWHEMAQVQRDFAAVEPQYDPRTRAYSESMRLTLHAAVLQHFAAPESNAGRPLFERFLELHVTAFHQNGGWVDNLQIPLSGAVAVVEATPAAIRKHALELAEGAFITDEPTVVAAQLVRVARRSAMADHR